MHAFISQHKINNCFIFLELQEAFSDRNRNTYDQFKINRKKYPAISITLKILCSDNRHQTLHK